MAIIIVFGYDITKKATQIFKIALISILGAFMAVVLIGLVIAKATMAMTPLGLIAMYGLFAIIVALVADISYLLSQKKKR